MLRDKNIVLGVSGSIAAYKAIYLSRLLCEAGAQLWPVLTRSATQFVGSLSFAAICGRGVITDLWSASGGGEIGHVELAHRADAFLIAPCTADLIARMAQGRAADPLTAIALATSAPRLLAPAMETGMWEDPATQENLAQLKERGWRVLAPLEGALASGRSGTGRMVEPEQILPHVQRALGPEDLRSHRVVVTGGPTREAFDPVRFISNPSTGKMGFALAQAAWLRGAEVDLITGPSSLPPPVGPELIRISTTQQLHEACALRLEGAAALVMAAAPSDYRPAEFFPTKLKKSDHGKALQVRLSATPDVLKVLKPRSQGCYTVGFAAESHQIVAHARQKLEAKDLDMIVANDVTQPGSGFAVDTNEVVFLLRDGSTIALSPRSKAEVAWAIWDRVVAALGER